MPKYFLKGRIVQRTRPASTSKYQDLFFGQAKMDYSIKKLPKSEIEIKVTVSEDEMDEYRKKASDEISKDVKVKGFRPGHVPPHILEEYIDKKYIEARAQEIAVQKSYAEAVIKKKLPVVSSPKVKIDSDNPFGYTAKVAVLPEVEIKDYKSIKVKKEEAKVTDKEIDAVIEDMRRYGTTYKEVDRAAQKGDRVEVDFEGFDKDGNAVPNTKSQNHPVIVGAGTLVPGFENELVGLKKGEKKEFEITFPKDYAKESFRGKKLKFKVELKMVEEASIPQFNEALIEKMTGKKRSVEEFKTEIKGNILARKTEEAKQKQENEYIEQLLKKAFVELPESLIDEEVEYILLDMKDDIQARGIEFQKFLEQAKVTEDELRKKYRLEGEKRLKIRLSLQYLLKEEQIKVEDQEIHGEFEKIKDMYPPNQVDKIQKEFDQGKMKNQLANRIALRKLFERVLVN